jgi:ABC-type Zn uptake system ZnuABC Zn-binding protein ZnuA
MGVLADWARQVGGDRIEVTSLLTGNESPHTYDIKPADVNTVADAGILFRIGLGLAPKSDIEGKDWQDWGFNGVVGRSAVV